MNSAIITACVALGARIQGNLNDLEKPLNTGTEEQQRAVDALDVSREHLSQLSDLLQHSTTKLVISLTKDPTLDAVASTCDHLSSQITLTTVCLRKLLYSPSSGACFKEDVRHVGRDMLLSFQLLAAGVLEDISRATALAGNVWQHCKLLKTMPLQNKDSISKAMLSHLSQVKDVKQEVRGMCTARDGDVSEAMAKPAVSEGGDDWFDEEDELSSVEKTRARYALALVKTVAVVEKHLYLFIVKSFKETSEEHVDYLEQLRSGFKCLCALLDDMGECLYSPQDIAAVQANTDAVRQSLRELIATACTQRQFTQRKFASKKSATQTHEQWLAGIEEVLRAGSDSGNVDGKK